MRRLPSAASRQCRHACAGGRAALAGGRGELAAVGGGHGIPCGDFRRPAEEPRRHRRLWAGLGAAAGAVAGTAVAAGAAARAPSASRPRAFSRIAVSGRPVAVAARCEAAAGLDEASGLEARSTHVGVAVIDGNLPCEDRHSILKLSDSHLAALVLDGHGGWQVAEWLRRWLLPELAKRLEAEGSEADVSEALEAAFAECEAALLRQVEASPSSAGLARALRIGACALCAVVGPTHIAVANAGDCQALLLRSGEPLPLTAVHNADQPEEQRRLRDEHPNERDVFVCRGGAAAVLDGISGLAQRAFGAQSEPRLTACYVKGRLQPTRSFGDFYLKDARYAGMGMLHPPLSPPYITAAPEVSVLPRDPKDEALVLASDGLWDYLSGVDVARVAREVLSFGQEEACREEAGTLARLLAQALLDEALRVAAREHNMREEILKSVPPGPQRRRLHDDITVVAILL